MADQQPAAADAMPGDAPPPVIRVIDAISDLTGMLGALALLAMTGIVCFEVFSRYVLNDPTYWGTDVATYILVGMTFIAMAQAQKADAHVRVELLLSVAPPPIRLGMELLAHWLGLAFVSFAAWQMIAFNVQEYVNGTRDWGLLATPQWLPELPISAGYVAFALAILGEIHRLRPPSPARLWAVPVLAVALAGLLWALGPFPLRIGKSPLDWGSVAIAAAVILSALAWSGWRIAALVAACCIGGAALFWQAKGLPLLPVGLLLTATLLVLLVIGVRVALALGIVGLLGLMFLLPQPQLSLLAERSYGSINTFTLTAVPMFVLMGALLLRSGVTTEMFDALVRWFGRTPGGIAHASVAASAVFAAVSGSSLATAATMGTVACPEMVRRGYGLRLSYGVVAAGATLGILIPPSIAMIIYGTTVGVAVTELFMAGIIPGILLSIAFMGGVLVWSLVSPDATPPGERYSWRDKIVSSAGVLPFMAVILAVLGSLYTGVATPTEAGGIGAAAAAVLCILRGRMTVSLLYETALETVRVTAFLMLIVVGAAIMSWVFDYLRIPRSLVASVEAADLAPWLIMLAIAAIYIVLGMFIDSISMILMTLPVTFPIATSVGVDPIWFGVALVILVEVGLITPPVGIVLFILRGIGGVALREIVYGVLPFVGIMLAFLVFLYIFPDVVTWLPLRMRQ